MIRFVWIRQNGRFSPQFWPTDGLGNPKGLGMAVIAAEYQLAEADADLSFDELIARYPAPTVVGDVMETWDITPENMKQIEESVDG